MSSLDSGRVFGYSIFNTLPFVFLYYNPNPFLVLDGVCVLLGRSCETSHRYLDFRGSHCTLISCLMSRYRLACQREKALVGKPLNGSTCINEEVKLGSGRSVAKLDALGNG